ISAVADFQPLDSPLNILVTGLTLLGLVALATSVVERRRTASPRPAYRSDDRSLRLQAIALYFAAGAVGATLVGGYEQFLQRVVTRTHLDVLHFSLHPVDTPRFAVGFGLILMHAAVVWGVGLLLHTVRVFRRIPAREEALPGFAWAGAATVVVIAQSFATSAVPLGPAALALAIAGLCSIALATLPRRARRVSQAARLAALFLALAAPSLAFYPSL